MKSTFDAGISNSVTHDMVGDRRNPPKPENQLNGFYIGIVMDDRDPQKRGRVWVYIPGISNSRADGKVLPEYGSNPPDGWSSEEYDHALRNGWLLVSPMYPVAGSDDFRNQQRGDTTSSVEGNITGYGFAFQPRVGDRVGVLFHDGNPSLGYYIGMVPPYGREGMLGGVSGEEKEKLSGNNDSDLVTSASPNARLPTYDKTVTNDDIDKRRLLPHTEFSRNLIMAGVAGDPVRGLGESHFGRESPSYVTGIKTPGWSYESEKNNEQSPGVKFGDNPEKYKHINSIGHQLTFDDHPDHQGVRLRTSKGAQIYLRDACDDPFIYIQTASGGVWIEIADSGNINIYAGASINIHAEDEINVVADKDMNLQVGGDFNLTVGGDMKLGIDGDLHHIVKGSNIASVGLDYSMDIGKSKIERVAGDSSLSINGEYLQSVSGNIALDADGDFILSADGAFNIEVADDCDFLCSDFHITSAGNIQQYSAGANRITAASVERYSDGNITMNSGGDTHIRAGGNINEDGANIYLNSGKAESISNPLGPKESDIEPPELEMPLDPSLPDTYMVQRKPNRDEVISSELPDTEISNVPVVPQHQPWVGGCGISKTSIRGGEPPMETIDEDRTPTWKKYIRNGAAFLSSLIPTPVSSLFNEHLGQVPAFSWGLPFNSKRQGEEPQYKSIRVPDPETMADIEAFNVDAKLLAFMKRIEPYHPTPVFRERDWIIGYGSILYIGDEVGGKKITAETLSSDSVNDIHITRQEAEELLKKQMEEIDEYLKEELKDVEITRTQYMGIMSFIYSVGLKRFKANKKYQETVERAKEGNFGIVQASLLRFSHDTSGQANQAVLNRRRLEASIMGTPQDPDGNTRSAIQYDPDQYVEVAGFRISPDVRAAICQAAKNSNGKIPPEYLFAIAAQESSFRPDPPNKSSSARGLFQITRKTAAGINVDYSRLDDPYYNANAAVKLAIDDIDRVESRIGRKLNDAEKYLLHMLGYPKCRKFLSGLSNNPNGYPALDGFEAEARRNKNVFYKGGKKGSPRTYSEIYQMFIDKITKRMDIFRGLCDGGQIATAKEPIPPVDTSIVPAEFDVQKISYSPVSTNETLSGSGLSPWLSVPSYTPGSQVKWLTGSRTPDFTNVHPGIIALVETSAKEAGIDKLFFNSGYRDPALNRRVGGAKKSQHMNGLALDISLHAYTTEQKRKLVERLCANGVRGIGIGVNTIHADIRPTTRPVTWAYRGGNQYVADILQSYGVLGKVSSHSTYS